ncbi:hypothetical protein C8F04DRAFT_558575 [Mycena alexandri]|uniref:Uncharacterized protein n=1 Tax=Mycena alexandri TaxID=1745969 RepID=A0AAD6SYL1_9AGAR|nr:hypothetical protein C8F04DRAFT_558575 [Mycena alexandri]
MAAPKVHVLGILGTTDVAANQDRWMAVDFAIMRDLFSEADTSAWFSAAILDNRDWPIIIGDPHSERLQLTRTVPSASQVNVVPLTALKTRFLHAVSHTAAQQEDTIVLVLCGHGDEDTGDLIIGGEVEYRDPLAKEDIELALSTLDTPQKRIFVISKACYSSLWRSDKWTLFAASDSHQTSAAMSTSGSGEGRGSGSGFTYALLAQRVGEHGLTAPHPVPKVDLPDGTYGKGPVIVRDTPVAARMHEPTARAKDTRPSTQEAHEFMESLKSTMGRTYKDADFILHPSSSLPSELPIRPFTSAFLPRLQVVDSSPPPRRE